jgi:hypothetical protein
VAVDELNEATTLAGGDLDVGDFAEALEEASELILGYVARQSTNEDGRVVGVGELVHLARRIVAAVRETLHTTPHGLLRNTSHHGAASAAAMRSRPSESGVATRMLVSHRLQ